jgi:hypothetical protein
VLLIRIGPKQREQRISPMIPYGLGDTEVGEERDALRLGEKRVKLPPIVGAKIEVPETTELYHQFRTYGTAGTVATMSDGLADPGRS